MVLPSATILLRVPAFMWRRFKKIFTEWLSCQSLPFWIGVIAVLLTLSSLSVGWLLDDYQHRLILTKGTDATGQLLKSEFDLFNFLDGDVERTKRGMDIGLVPWWTYPEVKGAFWRPLASLSHWLDYRLWPDTAWMMHVQSVLWYGLLCGVLAVLYRRIMGAALLAAGLAALLYAVDDGHSTPVGFLANRNAVMAAVFGVMAIISHNKWRQEGKARFGVLGTVLLLLSLLSAEAGIATCAYLGAYAVFIDRAKWRNRLASLLPYVAVVLIWRGVWSHLNYGVYGLEMYVDPVSEPLRYMSAVVERVPFLILGQWTPIPSGINLMLYPTTLQILSYCSIGLLVLIFALALPVLIRQREARFWFTGMFLSMLPACATVVSDRMLMFTGIGAAGLLGMVLTAVFGKNRYRDTFVLWRPTAMIFGCVLLISQLVINPIVLPFRTANPMGPKKQIEKLIITEPFDKSIEEQDLIIVNPPCALFLMFSSIIMQTEDQPIPARIRYLTTAPLSPAKMFRSDEDTLVVRPEWGYLGWQIDRLFRNMDNMFELGEKVELTGMTVEITELAGDGRPQEAKFTFDVPLEDDSLRWLYWKDMQFKPFTPPAVGETVIIPAYR